MLTTEGNIIKVDECLNGLYLSTNIEFLDLGSEICNGWVGRIIGAEDLDGFFYAVRLINVVNWLVFEDELGTR